MKPQFSMGVWAPPRGQARSAGRRNGARAAGAEAGALSLVTSRWPRRVSHITVALEAKNF